MYHDMLRKNKSWSHSIKAFLLKILFLFYLTSSYLSAVHIHHSDEAHADNCQVCIVVKILQNADLPPCEFDISILTIHYDAPETVCHDVGTSLFKGYYSTAPPL